jgi:hypothetical protein
MATGNPWDDVKAITTGEGSYTDTYNPFMACRIIAGAGPVEAYTCAIINCLSMPKRAHWQFLRGRIAKGRRYIKYFKAEGESDVPLIMERFKVTREVAEGYLPLIPKDLLARVREDSQTRADAAKPKKKAKKEK